MVAPVIPFITGTLSWAARSIFSPRSMGMRTAFDKVLSNPLGNGELPSYLANPPSEELISAFKAGVSQTGFESIIAPFRPLKQVAPTENNVCFSKNGF